VNRCVFYLEGDHPLEIPEGQEYDGLRFTVCRHDAEFMVDGSSYCGQHVKIALGSRTNRVGRKLGYDH
jgi:hypothetical protein